MVNPAVFGPPNKPSGLTEDFAVEPWGTNILLVEDDPSEAATVRAMLQKPPSDQFHITHVESAAKAEHALGVQDFSVVLLDLSLPDAKGLAPLEMLIGAAPDVPVVVMSGLQDQRLAVEAVESGAQDFLMKRHVSARTLAQSLRYAIERKRAESRLAYLAHFDQLTGLANRGLFQKRLDQALTRAEISSEQVALLYVDIDQFKSLNEQYGSDVGDRVLHAVGQRLRGCVRESELVARLRADEFGVIMEAVRNVAEVRAVADRIIAKLSEPIADVPVGVSVSVGVAIVDGRVSLERLVEQAANAVQRAKASGRRRVQVACASTDSRSSTRVAEALDRDELRLVYQPRLDLDRDRVTAVEAFLRFDEPVRGLLRPAEFMPAHDTGDLVLAVSDWAVQEAVRQAKAWRQAELPPLRVSINLAAAQFMLPDLVERLGRMVAEADAEPSWFELDCPESVLMDNPARSRMLLKGLQAAGFRTAIDDFGSGFGYLAELARLPLDALKIDRGVVEDLEAEPARRALVAAAVALGRELALEVVAEGVERESQVKVLRDIGATTVQGYWLAEPKAADGFAEWWTCRAAVG